MEIFSFRIFSFVSLLWIFGGKKANVFVSNTRVLVLLLIMGASPSKKYHKPLNNPLYAPSRRYESPLYGDLASMNSDVGVVSQSSAFYIDHTCGKPICGHPVCVSKNKNLIRPENPGSYKPYYQWKPREKLDPMWSRDLILAVAASLGKDCIILGRVCVKFCAMMCKADFWIFLLRRLTNWDSTKNPVIDITYRKYFLEYAGNSWDSTHVVRNNVKNVKVSNTNVCGTTLKMAVRANATTKYHTIKCVNPVPSGEGQFWAVGIRVNLIDTDSKTGFGILPKQSDEVYRCNSTLYPPDTSNYPWLQHANIPNFNTSIGFRRENLIVLAGIIHKGKHLCRFFKNGDLLNRVRIKIVPANIPLYPHVIIFGGESFTLEYITEDQYKGKLTLSFTHRLSSEKPTTATNASGSDSFTGSHGDSDSDSGTDSYSSGSYSSTESDSGSASD